MTRQRASARWIGVALVVLWSLVPIGWALRTSLQTQSEALGRPTRYLPADPTLGNFTALLTGPGLPAQIRRSALNIVVECVAEVVVVRGGGGARTVGRYAYKPAARAPRASLPDRHPCADARAGSPWSGPAGRGPTPTLAPGDRARTFVDLLFATLVYLRESTTFRRVGARVHLSASTVQRAFHPMVEMIADLGICQADATMPHRRRPGLVVR